MYSEKYLHSLLSLGCDVLQDEPMKDHTTFKIGGAADLFVTVYNTDQLIGTIRLCRDFSVPYMIIGNGSNLLVRDEGIRGAVIRLDGDFKRIEISGNRIECYAAASLSSLCHKAYENSLTGLEFAYGIPGSVGGAAFMNAGAYGREMKDVVVFCTHLTDRLTVESFDASELDFSYRHSVYTDTGYIVLSVSFELDFGNKLEIKANMDELMERRISKQPLDFPSAGSVFKRPVGNYAGRLIESCGLKGKSVGGAQVSDKHCGFIVNRGGASCADVCELITQVQDAVRTQTGCELEREIILI